MIPAERIKQIRAMFAKSKRQIIMRYRRSAPYYFEAGKGNLAAWTAAKPHMVRMIKDFRAGKPVPKIDSATMRAADFYHYKNIGKPRIHRQIDYYDRPSEYYKRGGLNMSAIKAIKDDNYFQAWERRLAGRRLYIMLRKINRGE